jgi:hypothetical protein
VFYQSSHPVFSMLLFMAYEALTTILMVNILIAAMTASYQQVGHWFDTIC